MSRKEFDFTGERFVPGAVGVGRHLELEHRSRYNFALDYVRDEYVLDVASGAGYGTFAIAQVARRVVGVDVSEEAIAYSSARYKAPNLSYRAADATMLDNSLDGSFSAIVSFETIEHVPNYDGFLSALRRVLRPGGTLLISTPDTDYYRKAGLPEGPQNEFHIHEFHREEFCSALRSHFASIELYGQSFFQPALGLKGVLRAAIITAKSSAIGAAVAHLIPETLRVRCIRRREVVTWGAPVLP